MSQDRRNNTRSGNDRRRETRWDLPWWGYLFSVLAVAAILTAFWALIYS